jgi:hypothetical protein
MTDPRSDAILPPLALAQLPGFLPLAAHFFFGYLDAKIHAVTSGKGAIVLQGLPPDKSS